MPLNDERPGSMSASGEDHCSDVESSSEHCDSITSASDLDCSQEGFASNNSSKHCTPSSSPPKALTLDEVMDSARELSNLTLAHEIIVNPNFHFEPYSPPQDSLFKLVKDNLHKAFWDILEAELNDDPPEYGQAIRLLEEIREVKDRFQQYFKMLICDAKPQGKLEQVPAGLTIIKYDLMPVAAQFLSLVNYNKTVYGPYYADIIRRLMFNNAPSEERPSHSAAQETAVSK
uniref:T-complex 11, testis-specific-like 2 n=1 Tax=Periophthalmus magnuspinnatus TaxID=409849 RepID=A0A3B3ZHG1_9GOBI